MMLQYFDDLAVGLEAKLRAASPDDLVARKRYALEIARLGSRLFSRREPVAWCGVLTPFDLLHAMGVTSCFVEFVGAMLASTGAAGGPLEQVEHEGYSTDCCSYHRAVTGAALDGMMPEPAFLIGTSAPCSGGFAVIENLARHYGKDLFVIHVPARRDEAAVAYLADELKAMIEFVAAHTGRPLDREKLRSSIENTNRTRATLVETYRLAASVPSPARSRDLVNFGIVMSLLLGTDGAVQVAQAYRDEFASKIRSRGASGSGERVRLMWLQNRIQFRSPIEDILERDLGASVVVDELNDVTWEAIDPEDPFPGIARRILSIPLASTAADRIRNLKRLARDYHIDGVINPCHWGCRQGTGERGLIERGMKEIGVPVLNLEVDCIDERNFALGQLKTRVEAFVETILGRKGAPASGDREATARA